MFSLKKAILLSTVLIFAKPTFAQQNPVDLKTLISRIDQFAPTLITDSSEIQIRQAEANETRFNFLPNLKLNYQADIGTNNNTTGGYFAFGIVPSNSGGRRNASNTNTVLTNLGIASFDWEVYNFGAYGAQNKAANSVVTAERNNFLRSKFQLNAYAISNYLELLRVRGLISIQQKNIDRNQQVRRSIMSLARSGIRAGVDTSIANAELSKARLNLIDLQNQLRQTQLQLAAISGLPAEQIMPNTAIVQQLINTSPLASVTITDTVNHPLINYYRALYQTNIAQENVVKKSYNPKILVEAAAWGRGSSLDANDHFNQLSDGFGFQRNNYLVGVGVSYNLFDIKRRQLRLNVQKNATNYALKQLQEQQNALALSAGQAYAELNTAANRLQEIPKQLNAAEAAYNRNFSLYKNGLINIVDLDAALNLVFRAETDETNAKNAYARALFQKAIAQNQVDFLLNTLK